MRVLVPLVTRTEILDFVCDTLAATRASLADEGLAFGRDTPLGAMIETAAAAPLVGLWADRVAYFAVGTNDLTASALVELRLLLLRQRTGGGVRETLERWGAGRENG